jgi:hypothetical protein
MQGLFTSVFMQPAMHLSPTDPFQHAGAAVGGGLTAQDRAMLCLPHKVSAGQCPKPPVYFYECRFVPNRNKHRGGRKRK